MNNDFKILTNETLKNVKTSLPIAEEKIAEWVGKGIEARNKRIDNFIIKCLKELGYVGAYDDYDLDEIKKFIKENNILLCCNIIPPYFQEEYVVECKAKNYKREMKLP